MDAKTKEQFIKLELMGFQSIEVLSKSKNTRRIYFIDKDYKEDFENVVCKFPFGITGISYMSSYIYDCIFHTWIKARFEPIPELTNTERVLYGNK